MKRIIEKFKNLFIRKNEVSNVEVCKDVFGTPIYENDYVVPIIYNEFARCGYATVRQDYIPVLGKYLTDYLIKCGVIRQADFLNNDWIFSIKPSHRRGFIHVYAPLTRVLPQYRHRTI